MSPKGKKKLSQDLLVARRRFLLLNLALVAVAVTGAYLVYRVAFAATVSGRVQVNSIGWGGVSLDCKGQTVLTSSTGHFSCGIADGDYYHVRVIGGLPSGASGGAINQRPGITNTNYEWQVAAKDCYQNTSCADDATRNQDLASDTGLDFRYSVSHQATVSGRVVVNGSGMGGVGLDCDGKGVTTDGNGNYSCGVPQYDYYHVRVVSGLPSGASGGSTVKRPGITGSNYEWQVTSYDCYQNSACPSDGTRSWDLAIDSGLNFSFTTPASEPPPPPPSPPPPSPSPSPSPPPPPPPSPSPSPSPSPPPPPPPPPPSSSGGGFLGFFRPKPPPPPPADDSTPPETPANFSAGLGPDGSIVLLSWSPSSDPSGIKGYALERSTDNENWMVVSDAITETSFSDKETAYDVKYYYRLKATDNADNTSGYSSTEITTGKFTANISDGDTVLQSDDQLVQAVLPAGSIDKDANCSVVSDTENVANIAAEELELVAGPYSLVCKDSSGRGIESFLQTATVSFTVTPDQAKRYKDLEVYRFNADSFVWEQVESEYDSKGRVFTVGVAEPSQLAVLGLQKPGLPLGIISFIVLLLLGGAVVFVIMLRKAQKKHYQSYLRKKYYNI